MITDGRPLHAGCARIQLARMGNAHGNRVATVAAGERLQPREFVVQHVRTRSMKGLSASLAPSQPLSSA